MEFRNLADLTFTDLLDVFNLSFSDYLVPFHLTQEQLSSKIHVEKIDMTLSVGTFNEGQIVAFILHAEKTEDGKRVIYNAGTGVVPDFRRKGLVKQMYDYILPVLQERKTDLIMLEVINGNEPAIRAYTHLGFKITRRLDCYKGNIKPAEIGPDITIQQLNSFQWGVFKSFWDIQPSWQSSVMVLEKMREDLIILGAYKKDDLIGYSIFNPVTGKVYQIAVSKEHRRNRIGTDLLRGIAEKSEGKIISINNVDDSSESTTKFLNAVGLENWVSQFEMENSQLFNYCV